jgi:hypothetical protein
MSADSRRSETAPWNVGPESGAFHESASGELDVDASIYILTEARGSSVGSGIYAISRKVAGSIPNEVIGCFNWPNPSSRIMALTEMSTRDLPGGKGWPAGA